MAFFGLFNYSKPGPGVDKNAPKKKRFFLFFELFFRKFWKLVQLNLLFLLFCIPIVTIGPAICGMTYVLRNFAMEKPTFLFSDFWDAFKNNWKQGFGLWLIFSVVSIIAGISFFWYFVNSNSYAMLIPFGLCILLCLILMFMQFYVYLMAVTVELKLQYILKNSLIFAFLGLKTNLITAFFVLLIAVPTALFFPLTIPILLFLAFSVIGFIVVFNSYPYIIKYIVEPHEQQMHSEDEDEDEDEEDEDDVIFTDIGSEERPVQPTKGAGQGKGKIIH
ncbi:MAG: YesL family protein [Candidatus Merdivicinus sp.]